MTPRGLTFVVVRGRNNKMGRDNGLLWHLPEDLKFFKQVTMGKPMIMGRKTFDSIGRPLPGRPSIVVSRTPQPDRLEEGKPPLYWRQTTQEALALAYAISDAKPTCIGGAEIFRLMLADCDEIWTTDVDDDPPADVFFPELDERNWQEIERHVLRGPDNPPQAIARRLVRIAEY